MQGVWRVAVAVPAALLLVVAAAFAGVDHSGFVKGPFKEGREITRQCLDCHDKQASDFIKTSHWKWKGTPNHVNGMENSSKEYGKINMINSFCTTVANAKDTKPMEACGQCHAGYGWTSTKFDHTDKTRIDCLVCHARKNYERSPTGCDIDPASIQKGKMDTEAAAQSVDKPGLKNCGYCHFYGGAGDNIKSPGLDSTLLTADKKRDVHMATKEKGGAGLLCQDCHKTVNHKIAGASSMMAHHDGQVKCEDCHNGNKAPHQKSRNRLIIEKHIASVACQTCHIPTISRGIATRTEWYWSDVGKNIEDKQEFGRETFLKHKGSFRWKKDYVPEYAWYNGQIERYMIGDRIQDPSKPVVITRPAGDIRDRNAKIYPYKLFKGSQPMDAAYMYLSTFQQYKSLWLHYDWDKALKDGAQDVGIPYSGKYRFVNTVAWLSAPHEVAPQENALQCGDCHFGAKRMNWEALGYKGDPMQDGGRNLTAKQTKRSKKRK